MTSEPTMDAGRMPGEELSSMGEGDMPHDTGATYELPADICPGMKEGDEMTLKIVSVKDGQYTVAYAPEKGGEGKEDGTPWESDFRKSMSAQEPQQEAS